MWARETFLRQQKKSSSSPRAASVKGTFQFWREAVDGQKNASIFLRSIFNPTHQSLPFRVLFLAIGTDLVGNAVEGSWGVNSVNSLPKVHSKVR